MKARFDSHISHQSKWTACLLALLSAALLHAQTPQPKTVSIEYHPPYLKVQVTQTANLQTVLENVCHDTGFQCSGLESASQASVAPIVTEGSVEKVIGELLEGAQLDYALLPASATGQSGQLMVQARKELPAAAPSMMAGSAAPEPSAAIEPTASNVPSSMESNPSQPVESQTTMAGEQSGPTEVPEGMFGSPYPDARRNPVFVQASQDSERTAPFPGADGKAMTFPSTQPSTVVLPFPDAQGHPVSIPYNPTQKSSSSGPFPPTK
jgi:hypothetical protein